MSYVVLPGSRHVGNSLSLAPRTCAMVCGTVDRSAEYGANLFAYIFSHLSTYLDRIDSSGGTCSKCLYSCLLQITRRASSLRLGALVQGLARRALGSLSSTFVAMREYEGGERVN